MAGCPNRHVVVLAPEERHGLERLASATCFARPSAPDVLPRPMLDPDVLSRRSIRPTCGIAGGEDAELTRFEKLIDHDPAVDLQA